MTLCGICSTSLQVNASIARNIVIAMIHKQAPHLLEQMDRKPRLPLRSARRFPHTKLHWTVRMRSKAVQKLPDHWEDECEKAFFHLAYTINWDHIHHTLLINSDQTQIVSIPGGIQRTYVKKGAKQIALLGLGEKRAFTCLIATTANQTILPVQEVWRGKTAVSLPSAVSRHQLDQSGYLFSTNEKPTGAILCHCLSLSRVYVTWDDQWWVLVRGIFGSPDMHNACPRHPQNFQSRMPLAGYEWYSSRLDTLWLRGFNLWWCHNTARSNGVQPGRACYFQQESFSWYQTDYGWLDRAKKFALQTRPSSAYVITGDLKPYLLCEIRHWSLPGQREWSRPELGVTEGLCHWLLIWGQLQPRTLPCAEWQLQEPFVQKQKCGCHLIYLGIAVVGCDVNLWWNHTIVLISPKTSVRYVGSVPDDRTIREWDVQVEVLTWYMISCMCGLILISGVRH